MSEFPALKFEITESNGRTVIGFVQGAGGMIQSEDHIAKAIRQATRGRDTHCYEPAPGHVDVYPYYNYTGHGPSVMVDLRGAIAKVSDSKQDMSETRLLLELADLINRGSFHGSWLVLSSASADNVAKAEKLLLEAERENLITRGNLDPSRDQLFFGVGGLTGAQLKKPHASAVCYHWITKTFEHL